MNCFPWGLSGITVYNRGHRTPRAPSQDTGALALSGKCLLSKHDNLRSILSTHISQEWWRTGEEEATGSLGLVGYSV